MTMQQRLDQVISPYVRDSYQDRLFRVVAAYQPRRVVEIGMMRGDSTEAIILALNEVGPSKLISIDPCDGSLAAHRVLPLRRNGVLWEHMQWFSHEFASHDIGRIDLLYIDGDHTEAGTRSDWEDYADRASLILFDDTQLPGPATVVKEITTDEFDSCEWECNNQGPQALEPGTLVHRQILLVRRSLET